MESSYLFRINWHRHKSFLWFLVETLDFKFLVKPKDGDSPCIVEEGPSRVLKGGTLEEDMRAALFKTKSDSGEEVVINCRVFLKEDLVSPFDLAASWRAYQENFQPSRVRGIPDVVMNVAQPESTEVKVLLDTSSFFHVCV